MSDRDKPADPDPDATVSMPARKPVKDEDATVAMTRDALVKPVEDDDATVTNLTRDALLKPPLDDDATDSIPPGGLRAEAAAEAAAAIGAPMATPAAFKAEAAGTPPSPPPEILVAAPSRMPMIAGGIVVLLVLLYFMFGGEKRAPTDSKAPAPSASSTSPAPAPAAPTPPAAPAPTASTPPASAPAAPPASTSPSAPAASAPAPSAPAASAPLAAGGSSKLGDLLAADIKRGTVVVADEGGGQTITIPLTHQFASGGSEPEPKLRAILLSVAAALDKTPGSIVVTGHADATPSSNAKFPSNQALSAARGEAAAKVMATKLRDKKRISSDGASDSKPIAQGDSTEARAKNRRVVIVLKPS